MQRPRCLRMPFLCPQTAPDTRDAFPGAWYLSPGIQAKKAWVPENCPLDGLQTGRLLQEMRAGGLAEVERLRLLAGMHMDSHDLEMRTEMADLACFANELAPDSSQDVQLKLELAQKNLLWLWLQEENIGQLAEIYGACASAEAALANSLRDTVPDSTATPQALPPDTSLLPSWKTCLVNAALFLPVDVPVLVEGAMRDHLLEELSFMPAPQYREILDCPADMAGEVVAASASIVQIIGFRPRPGAFHEIYHGSRVWLAWKDI